MTADNWAYCPQCQRLAKIATDKRNETLENAYGKLAREEYLVLAEETEAANSQLPRQTLREDYEIGIDEGDFFAAYSASCSVCHFEFEFKHAREDVEVEESEEKP